jgi:hypothetical protein
MSDLFPIWLGIKVGEIPFLLPSLFMLFLAMASLAIPAA